MKNKTIAVIGGTGKAGKFLVAGLIRRGFTVRLLARNPERLPESHPQVVPVIGNADNYNDILDLLNGCDAVISTLGLGQPNSPAGIFTQSTTHVLRAMETLKLVRYIVITGLNVDLPSDQKSVQTQAGTDWMKSHFPESTANKQLEFELLSQSAADWTLVRLPVIDLTDERRAVQTDLQDCRGNSIGAADLADFLIGQLGDRNFIGKAPFLFNV